MIFQRILKGVAGVDHAQAEIQLNGGSGLPCNWWHEVRRLPEHEIPSRLTEEDLLRHLSGYDQTDTSLPEPFRSHPFGKYTPFISTTAGTVERDPTIAENVPFSAFLTALLFATNNFTANGVIYYGYVNLLGKRAIKLREFSEETRDLHQWTAFQPYHPEGEIVAKINIPATHLERAECYEGPRARAELQADNFPMPVRTVINTTHFVPPETVCNIRNYL